MKHLGTKTLETLRLILRKFKLEDVEALYKNWASDPEVTKYLTWPAHSSVEVSRRVLESWLSAYDQADFYQWAIELKTLGEPVGTISVVGINEKAESLQIGYCIGKEWWGKGIMTEAFSEVIRFLFEEVCARRIEARHDAKNPASGAVMKKCGLHYEGTLRKSDWNNQGICDAVYYGLLREEYTGK